MAVNVEGPLSILLASFYVRPASFLRSPLSIFNTRCLSSTSKPYSHPLFPSPSLLPWYCPGILASRRYI
jgi:hypothetical protein